MTPKLISKQVGRDGRLCAAPLDRAMKLDGLANFELLQTNGMRKNYTPTSFLYLLAYINNITRLMDV